MFGGREHEGARININTHTVIGHDNNGAPWTYDAAVQVKNTGVLSLQANGTSTTGVAEDTDEWLSGSRPDTAYANLFEVFVAEVSFTGDGTRTGTMDTWIDCGTADSNRIWKVDDSTASDSNWVVNVKFRHKVSQIEYGNADITLICQDDIS
jgi:hypothetical protein